MTLLRRYTLPFVLVLLSAMISSLPPDRILLSAENEPTRLSKSNPFASLVIPKQDLDAGKISYRAIVPGDCLTSERVKEENQITLIGGVGGCMMSLMWRKDFLFFGKKNAVSGVMADFGAANFVSVEVFENGDVSLNNGYRFRMGCNVVSKINSNTAQGGKIVDFLVDNIVESCADIEIEFDKRYEMYEPVDGVADDEMEILSTSEQILSYLLSRKFLLFLLKASVPMGLFLCTLIRDYYGLSRFVAVTIARVVLVCFLFFAVVLLEVSWTNVFESLTLFSTAVLCAILTMHHGLNMNPIAAQLQGPAGQVLLQPQNPGNQPQQPQALFHQVAAIQGSLLSMKIAMMVLAVAVLYSTILRS